MAQRTPSGTRTSRPSRLLTRAPRTSSTSRTGRGVLVERPASERSLPVGRSARRASECEVAQPDTPEVTQPRRELAPRELSLTGSGLERLQPSARVRELERVPPGERQPGDAVPQRVRVEPGAPAVGADRVGAVA